MTVANWMLADALGLNREQAVAASTVYRIFVRDLVMPFRIGIHAYEKERPQRVRVNAELLVAAPVATDALRHVVNYEAIVEGVRRLSEGGHIPLVEKLAEEIMELCFADPRVAAAKVSVEKLDVYPEAESVGVTLRRRRPARLYAV